MITAGARQARAGRPLGRLGRSSTRRSDPKAAVTQRADIQGLRMIAVVAVVVNHLTGHPKGGFLGVDVFFVISGFLITGHLLRDLGRTKGARDYIGGFYRRRIRRLMPAALLVIVCTIVAAHAMFNPVRFGSTWRDGAYAAGFWANWHFIEQSTDYFAANGPESPFRHYWSLSVEEQFYVVWPIALFLLGWAALGRLRGSVDKRRLVGAIAATVLCAGSLALAFVQSSDDPAVAYFSTFTRAWELGLGAVLACVTPYFRAGTKILTAMSWTGLALIGISLFTVSGDRGFPAPGALLPCLGSGLVLGAVGTTAVARNALLTNRLSVFIGDISYSIYLVHWPVIVLLKAEMPNRGSYFYLAASGLALGLSILLYALVEQPVLRSNWLLPGRGTPPVKKRDPGLSRIAIVGLALSAFGLAAFAWWPGATAELASRYAKITEQTNDSNSPTPALPPKAKALQAELVKALAAPTYPALVPSIGAVVGGPTTPTDITVCAVIKLQPPSRCTWGKSSAKHSVYLVGDSTSMVYSQALAKIVTHTRGWKFRFAGAYGCRFNSVVFKVADPPVQRSCQAHTEAVVDEIKRVRPDTLMVTNSYGTVQLASDGSGVSPAAYAKYLEAELSVVRPFVNNLIIVAAPPNGGDIANCYHPGGEPVACVSSIPSFWRQIAAVESDVAKSLHAQYIDSEYWFCTGDGYCPAFAGTTVTMHDVTHASTPYMDKIWPVIGEALTRSGAFRGR